jgi:hypothetical protein
VFTPFGLISESADPAAFPDGKKRHGDAEDETEIVPSFPHD